MCGVNGDERGSGRGPCTVHVSFSAEADGMSEVVASDGGTDGSNSRYAEPEAEGVRPVLRSVLARQHKNRL